MKILSSYWTALAIGAAIGLAWTLYDVYRPTYTVYPSNRGTYYDDSAYGDDSYFGADDYSYDGGYDHKPK